MKRGIGIHQDISDFAIPFLLLLHRYLISEYHLKNSIRFPTSCDQLKRQRRKRPRQENPEPFTSYTVFLLSLCSRRPYQYRFYRSQKIGAPLAPRSEKMATVQATSTSDPQDAYVAPPKATKDRRFSSSKEPTSKGMYIMILCFPVRCSRRVKTALMETSRSPGGNKTSPCSESLNHSNISRSPSSSMSVESFELQDQTQRRKS